MSTPPKESPCIERRTAPMMQHHEQETRETLPQPKAQAPVKRPPRSLPEWFKTTIRRLAVWLYTRTNPPDTDQRLMMHDRIRAVAKRVNNAETALHARIALLIMADVEQFRWEKGAKALIADLKEIETQGGFIGGFAPDQWEQIRQAVRDTMTGARFTEAYAGHVADLVKARLEQQNGGSPS